MRIEGRKLVCALLAAAGIVLGSCTAPAGAGGGREGTLLIVGGGLDNDSREIWERFVELSSAHGPARILVASAATGDEEVEIVDKTEALRVWAPGVPVGAIRRATSTADSVAAIDAATGIFFTGGDQKRIVERYRPGDMDTPEWSAMRRLLARGGVIGGGSAGDAMMGTMMLLGGGSASALGIAPKPGDLAPGEDPPQLGARIGPGMRFQPWVFTDSHFFERDRVGRLVVALEASSQRLGIGVGEDAAVELDLASATLTGVTGSESLLVDAAHLRREGLRRTGLLARTIGRGDMIDLRARLATVPALPAGLAGSVHEVPVVEPGQNRQLASWRLFRCAAGPSGSAQRLVLDGWQVMAWPAANGEAAFEVGPLPANP